MMALKERRVAFIGAGHITAIIGQGQAAEAL